ncbi:MAG TPA: ubiquitin carboxyl-hydrolase [Gammaproteobacteria bacterium]|nr:ubiquitin carboxyl-hydrolase [Gammaproteobacteria bacterium]
MGGKGSGPRSTYSEATAKRICAALAKGTPLAQICRAKGMPHTTTVLRWQGENEDFAQRYTRARDDGFDQIAADCLDIADSEGADVQRDKLRVDTRLRLLRAWDPKRYGDKLGLTGGDGKSPIALTIERRPVRAADAPDTD